ncbi:DUF4097 family beta strand repeat-containing protein [Mycetocola zhadangensis]|uniref:DUF4097 domain-containing protein n=1 Tax=Mycetocola zhadangensis TaxID=1164595 RepID=A0A3L7J0Z1_9MICO|nr:DUF4097 family beta strand repeat-containing protein [Mycetocola zhadangensis]RLQ84168.1 hypothetical protein D9V28_08050 [Mycetocola zhadangensis]GGE95506.1 hypothetical protein GCM10011313_18130 [Mycetocola zhadangensis]
MTTPPPTGYPPAPPPQRMSRGLRLFLLIGIPILVIVLIVAFAISLSSAIRAASGGSNVSQDLNADAGSSVSIDVPNAALFLGPSDDDRVHVTMQGTYSGTKPELSLRNDDGETEITGGCPRGWFLFNRCSVRIEVQLPAELDVEAEGQNGGISASELDGDLDLSTTNGTVSVEQASGRLMLETTNGRIELTDVTSTDVEAETTNGAVLLAFTEAPDAVSARSTNGEISVRVPDDDESYRVDADTTNGKVNTADIRTDPDSDRSITARTTNGRVTVEQAG